MADPKHEVPDDVDLAIITSESFLFLIDCSVSMNDGGEECVLKSVFQTIANTMRLLAVNNSAKSLNFGILLYNVQSPNFVTVFKPLGPLVVQDVKQLFRLVYKDYRDQSFKPVEANAEAIVNVLSAAKAEISRIRARSLFRLIIATDDDDPVKGSAKLLSLAQTSMSDLSDLRAVTMPIFVPRSSESSNSSESSSNSFSESKFWNKLVYTPSNMTEYESRLVQCSTFLNAEGRDFKTSLEKAISGVLKQPFVRHGILKLGKAEIGVSSSPVYVKRPVKLIPLTLATFELEGKTTTEIVETKYTFFDKITGEECKPGTQGGANNDKKEGIIDDKKEVHIPSYEHGEYSEYSDENNVYKVVSFTANSNAQKVLRFGTIGAAKLIVPCNNVIERSSAAFASLYRNMLTQQVSAVVMLYRTRGPPIQGMMYACNPEMGWEYKENGLAFVRIPFEDDIRMPKDERVAVKYELESCQELETLIQKMKMRGYDPGMFKAPTRSQNEHVLECQVLGMAMEGQYEVPDSTTPRYESMKRYVGNATTTLAHKFGLSTHYIARGNAEGAKRVKLERFDQF